MMLPMYLKRRLNLSIIAITICGVTFCHEVIDLFLEISDLNNDNNTHNSDQEIEDEIDQLKEFPGLVKDEQQLREILKIKKNEENFEKEFEFQHNQEKVKRLLYRNKQAYYTKVELYKNISR